MRQKKLDAHSKTHKSIPVCIQKKVTFHLCASYVHASRIETMLYLCRIVHLKNIASTKLNIIWLLTVLKEVNIETHLATSSTWTITGTRSFFFQEQLLRSSLQIRLIILHLNKCSNIIHNHVTFISNQGYEMLLPQINIIRILVSSQ
jgi:hypothetical protein